MEFRVGDVVRVKNWGKRYTANVSWFREHKNDLKIEWIICYPYDDRNHASYTSSNEHYKVLYCADGKALITRNTDDCFHTEVYLISTEGIELANPVKEMKLSEVEKILGYRVKIVSEESEEE